MEYRILGPLELVDDGRPVVLGARKQRALLLCLLLHANEVVSADALIDARLGRAAAVVGGQAGAGLRLPAAPRAGRRARIETRAHGYVDGARARAARRGPLRARCSPPGARRWRRRTRRSRRPLLRRALALWRGRPLEDADHAAFAVVEAGRLEELRLACVEERLDADLALGRHDEVLAELASLVAEHPLRERLRAQLMLALYRCGRQADALDAYADARTRAARRARPRARAPSCAISSTRSSTRPRRSTPRAPAPSAGGAIPVPSSALVGRRGELRELTAMVTREDVRIVTRQRRGRERQDARSRSSSRATAGARFANGVAFVELAAVRDAALVPRHHRAGAGRVRDRPGAARRGAGALAGRARGAARGRQLRARRRRGARARAPGRARAAADDARHEPPGPARLGRARLRARPAAGGRCGGAVRRARARAARDAAGSRTRPTTPARSWASAGASTACRSRSSWPRRVRRRSRRRCCSSASPTG